MSIKKLVVLLRTFTGYKNDTNKSRRAGNENTLATKPGFYSGNCR